MAKRDNTASKIDPHLRLGKLINDIAATCAVMPSNRRTILGTFSAEETISLGAMLDRLDALEEAVRVRPNAKAIAALRESIAIDEAIGDEIDASPESSLATQAAAILLEMLDKIVAAGKPEAKQP